MGEKKPARELLAGLSRLLDENTSEALAIKLTTVGAAVGKYVTEHDIFNFLHAFHEGAPSLLVCDMHALR